MAERKKRARNRSRYPYALEQTMKRAYTDFVETLKKVIDEQVSPAIEMGSLNAYYMAEARVMKVMGSYPTDGLKASVQRHAELLDGFNDRQFKKQLRSALGVDVFKSEPKLQELLKTWETSSLRLISTITPDHLDKLNGILSAGFRNGTSTRDLTAQVQDAIGVTTSRARTIARTTISQLNGELTKYRQTNIGIEEYDWAGVMDNRERASHVAREGMRYRWDSGPPGGLNPGMEVNCRCVGTPVFPDLKDIDALVLPIPGR